MIKKLTLLAMAVAALGAFAVPASASAAEFKFEGKPLEEPAEVEYTGPAGFSAFGGAFGIHWIQHMLITYTPGNVAHITSALATECTGTGALSGFTCHTTAEELPWTAHCKADGSLDITNTRVKFHFTPEGFVSDTTLTGNIIASGEEGSLDSVTLSGEGTALSPGNNPVTVTGSLEASTAGYSCS